MCHCQDDEEKQDEVIVRKEYNYFSCNFCQSNNTRNSKMIRMQGVHTSLVVFCCEKCLEIVADFHHKEFGTAYKR